MYPTLKKTAKTQKEQRDVSGKMVSYFSSLIYSQMDVEVSSFFHVSSSTLKQLSVLYLPITTY